MAKPKKTVEQICNELLGQEIEEIEVNYDEELICIYTTFGLIEFTGDGLEMYVESDKLDS